MSRIEIKNMTKHKEILEEILLTIREHKEHGAVGVKGDEDALSFCINLINKIQDDEKITEIIEEHCYDFGVDTEDLYEGLLGYLGEKVLKKGGK